MIFAELFYDGFPEEPFLISIMPFLKFFFLFLRDVPCFDITSSDLDNVRGTVESSPVAQ